MQRAFLHAFATGGERVVMIGSDCPTVTSEDIETAWTALASHDLVLGPAADGGYWLIGLRTALPELFEGIAWSTNAVLGATLKRAAHLDLRIQFLSERTDIDTENDWQEFLRRKSCV
jgi:rSAM/selenodomain-associated transferase 1